MIYTPKRLAGRRLDLGAGIICADCGVILESKPIPNDFEGYEPPDTPQDPEDCTSCAKRRRRNKPTPAD